MPRSVWRGSAVAARVAIVCAALICAGASVAHASVAHASVAHAETLPASIRACAQEPDSLKRLICFDKEVARYSDQPATGEAPRVPPIGGTTHDLRTEPTTPTVRPGPPREDRSDSGDQPAEASPPRAPKHVAARIASIENFPDALVLHLDNGQVWEQIQEASADLNLHAGDAVSIDREMGSFWLAGKNGVAMKVRLKK